MKSFVEKEYNYGPRHEEWILTQLYVTSLCYSGMWVRKDITLERGLVALVSMLIHDFGSHSEKVSVETDRN